MLAELTGNKQFAEDFFDKYVEGREVVDYAKLLLSAGYVMRPSNPDSGWVGRVQVQEGGGGITITGLVPFGTPAYDAGLDTRGCRDDDRGRSGDGGRVERALAAQAR